MDVTCIGLTTLDILARPVDALPSLEQVSFVEEITLVPAGTAGGTAVICAKLGLNAALISAVGSDVNGWITRSLLTEADVNTRYVTTENTMPTSTTILPIRSDGERPNFHMLGASILTQLTPQALETAKSSKVFHFAGVGFPHLLGDDIVEALASLQDAGVTVTCDLIAPQSGTLNILENLLPHVDIFMPSRAEVAALFEDEPSDEDAVRRFVDLGAKHCIIKLGDEGAIGLIDGELTKFPAIDITPVDTTSCGDSFCAGLIYGLVHGLSLEKAAKYGIATASLVAQGLGTTGALGGIDDVLKVMEGS